MGVVARHYTKTGENVGIDEFKPADLCGECADLIRRLIPGAFKMDNREERMIAGDPVSMYDDPPPIRVAASQDQIAEERRQHP
jgi:hypothetical protein